MKIGILHHELEFAEKNIAEVLNEKGVETKLVDIRESNVEEILKDCDLILNRVYASVANRDYPSIPKTLELLKKLEKEGIKCINSYKTSLFDYNKYESFLEMKKNGIPNPETILIENEENLEEKTKDLCEKLRLPMIIKRNIGGRGKDISRIESYEEALNDLKNKFKNSKEEGYFGGFIAQEFIKSSRNHDCRIGIINGKFEFSYSRSLISLNSEDAWLASCTKGSVEGIYNAEEPEKKISLKASESIGSEFNELDIMFTENGPVVIENNPTPNYFDEPEDRKRIIQFTEIILKKLNEK